MTETKYVTSSFVLHQGTGSRPHCRQGLRGNWDVLRETTRSPNARLTVPPPALRPGRGGAARGPQVGSLCAVVAWARPQPIRSLLLAFPRESSFGRSLSSASLFPAGLWSPRVGCTSVSGAVHAGLRSSSCEPGNGRGRGGGGGGVPGTGALRVVRIVLGKVGQDSLCP